MGFLPDLGSIYQYSFALLKTAPLMVAWWCFVVIYILVTLPNFFLKKPFCADFMSLVDFLGLVISGAICPLSISFHEHFWWLFVTFQLSWFAFLIYALSHMGRIFPNDQGGAMIYIAVFYPWMFTSPAAILIYVVYKYVLGY